MAHWAELDENNVVTRVLVGDNNDPNGDEGYQWLIDNLGGRWIKTSYNGNIRKNYAGVGFYYDESVDAFVPPKPYESWIFNENTALWQAPIERPSDGNFYSWNEEDVSWDAVEIPE
jgi:hypothetical protein